MKLSYNLLASSIFLSMFNYAQAQSLEDAVAQTISSNPNIRSEYHNFMIKKSEIGVSQGQYLPSLNLDGKFGHNFTKVPDSNNYEAKQIGLTLTQLIWDGNNSYNNIQRTKQEAEAERYQLGVKVNDMALATADQYLKVIRAQQKVKLSEKNYQIHKQLQSDIEKRTNAGLGSTSDLYQANARLAKSQSLLLSSEQQLADVKSLFIQQVGYAPLNLVMPEVDQRFMPLTLKDAQQTALEFNPVMKLALHDVQAAEYRKDQTHGNYLPKFTVEAKQTWGDDVYGPQTTENDASISLNMHYNLFNGGQDYATNKKAAYDLLKTKDIKNNAQLQLKTGTDLAWTALNANQSQLSFIQQHVEASSKTVYAYREQFKLGQRSLLDVLNTENELYQAKVDYIDTEYQRTLAEYRLLNATGKLLPELRITLAPDWQKAID
ncbi:TolC family outer membrane protein [Shewanella marina]|uniref:TolC family outer membrane protein n=1 Tax=Shewanella marina TaxID=487319 RepID=UPI000470159E|nr:TolC family outer membrane protein [Shewanella marina]